MITDSESGVWRWVELGFLWLLGFGRVSFLNHGGACLEWPASCYRTAGLELERVGVEKIPRFYSQNTTHS